MNTFPESRLAHEYLDGLNGCEIGASPENPFNIRGGAYCNIDIPATDRISHNAYYHNNFAVNIFADGAHLPFKDNCMDYVLSSHVVEHFFDTIGAISEWLRVIRPGGYVFMIIPHKDRIYDINRPVTTVAELLARHSGKLTVIRKGNWPKKAALICVLCSSMRFARKISIKRQELRFFLFPECWGVGLRICWRAATVRLKIMRNCRKLLCVTLRCLRQRTQS